MAPRPKVSNGMISLGRLKNSLIYYRSIRENVSEMEKLKTIESIGSCIRREQPVSQETLAALAGTGARYISELERGKETIDGS